MFAQFKHEESGFSQFFNRFNFASAEFAVVPQKFPISCLSQINICGLR
jgi:hypothetical protein